jgi:hypothetical protein
LVFDEGLFVKGHYCPRVQTECPNGTLLEDVALNSSLRIAYEDGVSIRVLSEVLKRHHCTIRAAIISAGGTIRSGPYPRGSS